MQAVILSFDSLASNALGCYGNEWIETPNWDRLAADGIVFDRHFADTVGLDAGMSWAIGTLANSPATTTSSVSLGNRLRESGVASTLITANNQLHWQIRAEFDSTSIVDGRDGFEAQPDEVSIAQLVKAGLSKWNDASFQKQPRLLWLHAPSPSAPPHGFDSLYFEDFEERGQQISELSDEVRLKHPAVYAGTVSLIDHWLGELLTGIESNSNSEPTLVIVMAAKGHLWQQIAKSKQTENQDTSASMSDQCIRAPLVLKVIGDRRFLEFRCFRSGRLVQTCDLIPTLIDWFGVVSPAIEKSLDGQSWLREATEEVPSRPRLLIRGIDYFDALRTSEWLCVRDKSTNSTTDIESSHQSPRAALYAKPEDIWDVNDIACQQPDLVNELLNHFPAI